MKTDFFEFSSEYKLLSAVLWLPEIEPKAVLQITHGMTEHIGRYEEFAEQMTAIGIAVCGFDLRGHGKNGNDEEVASFGENGWQHTLNDMRKFFEKMKKRIPNVPYFMMGFSLGSFLLREYLSLYPNDVDGAIIIGTGYQPAWILSIMKAIVKREWKKVGFDNTTTLVKKLSFETYNQNFQPNETDSDWLCADKDELFEYMKDPFCRKYISAGLFWQLLDSMKRTGKRKAASAWKKDMPVLLLSGENDPVGNNGRGVRAICQQLRKLGMTDITMQLFPNARHDLLHEKNSGNADAAIKSLLHWMGNYQSCN
jgi:alpha-beta hydrolase superfamily lysophospholipase